MALRNFNLNLDDATYQAALGRAQGQGKTLEQILVELVAVYAQGGTSGGVTSYTVQRGDTLSKIARTVYGDPHKYQLIQQANNLPASGQIWVGQVLLIPPLQEMAPTPPAPPPLAPPTPAPAPPTSPPAPVPAPAPPPPAPLAPAPAPSPPVSPAPVSPAPVPAPPPRVDPCAPIPGVEYRTLPIAGRPTDRPAAQHGDINLALRGYAPTAGKLSLIDLSGPADGQAPQLAGLFADKRTGILSSVYRAHHWDWGRNARGAPVTDYEVTVAGFEVEPGETVHVPEAGYDIGQGYTVLVLYADTERITLKYTGEDNVVAGYTVHVEGVCVEPTLRALYDQMNASGRSQLPALRAGQPFGRARGAEIQVAIRDRGAFMDPRVRKDWWRGR